MLSSFHPSLPLLLDLAWSNQVSRYFATVTSVWLYFCLPPKQELKLVLMVNTNMGFVSSCLDAYCVAFNDKCESLLLDVIGSNV